MWLYAIIGTLFVDVRKFIVYLINTARFTVINKFAFFFFSKKIRNNKRHFKKQTKNVCHLRSYMALDRRFRASRLSIGENKMLSYIIAYFNVFFFFFLYSVHRANKTFAYNILSANNRCFFFSRRHPKRTCFLFTHRRAQDLFAGCDVINRMDLNHPSPESLKKDNNGW